MFFNVFINDNLKELFSVHIGRNHSLYRGFGFVLPHYWVYLSSEGVVLNPEGFVLSPEGFVLPHFWDYLPPEGVVLLPEGN